MSDLNTTVEKMSKEDLENEYLSLKTQNQTLIQKLDNCEQQLYETKRQLTTSKHMEEELSAELESLQNNDASESDKLFKKITTLEEEIVYLKQSNMDVVQQLEQDLKDKETETEGLKEKMNNVSVEVANNNKQEVIEKLNDEVYELKSKNETLLEQIEEHKIKNEEITRQKVGLENRLSDISHDLEEMKEFFAIKKEELEASNERFHNLQDELMVTQMELDKFKNVPQDQAKKGNSLFAEVEDNRQKLKKYVQTMNKKYADMKASYNRKSLELQKIHSAYAVLRTEMEQSNNLEDDPAHLIKCYEKSVETLKENIEALKKELILRKEATDKILNGQQKSTEALIEISRKEVMELRTQLTCLQFSRIACEKALHDARVDLKKWRLQTLSLHSENLILQQTVADLKIKNSSLTNSPLEPQDMQPKSPKKELSAKSLQVKNQLLKEQKINKPTDKAEIDFNKILKENPIYEEIKDGKIGGKYEGISFCKQRTLTVVENDLLDPMYTPNSLADLDVRKKYNIPNFSSAVVCDDSFEEFTDEISLKKPLPDHINDLENNLLKLNLNDRTEILEDNKENKDVKFNEKEVGERRMKDKKVSFSADTVENKRKAPMRRGKILVPTNQIIL